MAQETIKGSEELAKRIKNRRKELGLTIEEAASKAGVGSKTWSRYESGESIGKDKCKGICKALGWHIFPYESEDESKTSSIEKYRNHEAWSDYLENTFGPRAAMAFAVGSDILLDSIEEDISRLSSLGAGSHIGQLDYSFLKDELPAQFLLKYDYDFLYQLKCALIILRSRARCGISLESHSVMEELLIFISNNEATDLIELDDTFDEEDEYDDEWIFDLFGDMDLITCLYSNFYLFPDHSYHFNHWNEYQFYMDTNSKLNNL